MIGRRRPMRGTGLLVVAAVLLGCTRNPPHLIWFEVPAPALVDLGDMKSLGVICLMNVERDEEIDRDFIRSRIADEISDVLRRFGNRRIVDHDEIQWAFEQGELDSSTVRNFEMLRRVHEKLKLDGLVLVEINRATAALRRRVYPIGPGPMGGMRYEEAMPLVYLDVAIQFDVLDARTGKSVWRKAFERSKIQPITIHLIGGGKERQILDAVRPSIRMFLRRLMPMRRRKIRGFVMSEKE